MRWAQDPARNIRAGGLVISAVKGVGVVFYGPWTKNRPVSFYIAEVTLS